MEMHSKRQLEARELDGLYHGGRIFTIGDSIAWREAGDVWEFEIVGHWLVAQIHMDGDLVRQFLETDERDPDVLKGMIRGEKDLFALIFTHAEHSEHWEHPGLRPINKKIDFEKENRDYLVKIAGTPLRMNEREEDRRRLSEASAPSD